MVLHQRCLTLVECHTYSAVISIRCRAPAAQGRGVCSARESAREESRQRRFRHEAPPALRRSQDPGADVLRKQRWHAFQRRHPINQSEQPRRRARRRGCKGLVDVDIRFKSKTGQCMRSLTSDVPNREFPGHKGGGSIRTHSMLYASLGTNVECGRVVDRSRNLCRHAVVGTSIYGKPQEVLILLLLVFEDKLLRDQTIRIMSGKSWALLVAAWSALSAAGWTFTWSSRLSVNFDASMRHAKWGVTTSFDRSLHHTNKPLRTLGMKTTLEVRISCTPVASS